MQKLGSTNDKDERKRLLRGLEKVSTGQRCLIEQKIANSRDTTRLYGYVRKRMNTKDNCAVLVLEDGSKITDDFEKSEILRKHFKKRTT